MPASLASERPAPAGDAHPLRHPLVKKLVGVTVLKLLGLAVIYALFFGPTHRLALDPAARIAGAVPASIDSSIETR